MRGLADAGRLRQFLDRVARENGYPENWRLSDAEREATRAGVLARKGRDLWVFAYGSLMWDPGIHIVEIRTATLAGFHRSFCLKSQIGRGNEFENDIEAGPEASIASRARDRGRRIPNFNDDFKGRGPDIGASRFDRCCRAHRRTGGGETGASRHRRAGRRRQDRWPDRHPLPERPRFADAGSVALGGRRGYLHVHRQRAHAAQPS